MFFLLLACYYGLVTALITFSPLCWPVIVTLLFNVNPGQVGKPVEEVVRYGEAFWRQGPKNFSADAWRRINTRIEMREKKLGQVRAGTIPRCQAWLGAAFTFLTDMLPGC